MNSRIDNWIDSHREPMIEGLKKCLSFRSVEDFTTAAEGAPFGIETAKCLENVLEQAKALGFDVKNYDGYCGAVDYGEGDEQLAILCHLDVVPEGKGWTYPPYAGEIHDGRLYARGATDDKGPAFAALYGLAAVKAAGLPMKRRVRIILGCNEESGMGCLKHYNKVEKAPDMAFSPDAGYPLVNSEKTIFNSNYVKEYKSHIRLEAGTVSNAVPGEAVCELELPLNRVLPIMEAFMEKSEFPCSAEATDNGCRIKILGVAAHASLPEMGKNALLAMFALLNLLPLEPEDAKTVAVLHEALKFDCHGESLGIDHEDASGRLSLNCGVANWDETGIKRLTIDVRAPNTSSGADIQKALIDAFGKAGIKEESCAWGVGYYVSPDTELVSSLLKVYTARTGIKAEPLAIGGGTYARHLKNAVAFGTEREGDPTRVHMTDENIDLNNLIEDCKMIADAIVALAAKEA